MKTIVVAWTVGALALAGCGGSGNADAGADGGDGGEPPVCPTAFTPDVFGWTSPMDFEAFSSISLELTFTNDLDGDLLVTEFRAGAIEPLEELTVTSSNLPVTVIGMGTQFTIEVTVDVSTVSPAPTEFLFDLSDGDMFGTLRPDRITLDSVDASTCAP